MATRIRFFGFASFEILTPRGLRILIDPYLERSSVSPVKCRDLDRVDLLLVTHAAWDHIGDTAIIARDHGCPVVCGPEVKRLLVAEGVPREQILAVIWGLTVEFRGIRIRPVESRHGSRAFFPDGSEDFGLPMGFIVYVDDRTRIYHMGDTAIFSDLRLIGELYRPNIGLVHVSLPDAPSAGEARVVTGEMTPYEAALACHWLGLDYALPCHFLDPRCEDVRHFMTLLESMCADNRKTVRPVVLEPGAWWTFEG